MLKNLVIPNWLLLAIFIISFALFFWGIYKAIQTKEFIYSLAFIPALLLVTIMFMM